MPVPKKEGLPGGAAAKLDSRTQNGNRQGFRTDASISNSRYGERALKPWVPDTTDGVDSSLEGSSNSGPWDQFAENERLFGLKTDYDENIYTTAINRSHPQFRERCAAADKKAREIERSAPATAHVAEERVMDWAGGNGDNEEDKYSGVRRHDFPPLSTGRENRYTPPAKRAPTSQSTVKGAPVDPAIISSQIRGPSKRQAAIPDQSRAQATDVAKNGISAKSDGQKSKLYIEALAADAKMDKTGQHFKTLEAMFTEKGTEQPVGTAGSSSSSSSSRNPTPQEPDNAPSATSTVEHDVLQSFKSFATQQRINAEKVRSSKARADKEVKLIELKNFANSFKLSTPVPSDLVSIIAKDPAKQKEIQAKAMKNAEEMARSKAEIISREKSQAIKDMHLKAAELNATTANATDVGRPARAPGAPQASGPSAPNNRHAGSRTQFNPYHAQPYRNNRGGQQHAPPQQQPPPPQQSQQQPQQSQQQTGNLAQRLRHMEQQRFSQPPPPSSQHQTGQDMRAPPTGPANNVDTGFNRRLSAAPSHIGAKLNPNSHEFRPGSFAVPFNPNSHPSAGSSPRAAANNVAESPATVAAQTAQLVRRKAKAVDVSKCFMLTYIASMKPPAGRNWDDNGGLRPSYDTIPTWRQLQDDEKVDSTMHLTYKEHFERQPFANQPTNTPNPQHVMPHMAHQHQLPFHLQHGSHNMGSRQSPHMTPMQMHAPQQGPVPHPPFGADDHRMMHSNSAQSFASPRMGQLPVAYPGQVPYNQPVYMGPQMGQYRSFSNSPHYVPPQQGQMGAPVMMQPQFIPGPQGMVAAPPMLYHGGHGQFMPPSGPPQPVPGGTGYPSPGRPAAPVMVHQGSQQGQALYGMSPSVQYNQPAYGPGQPNGPMPNSGGQGGPVWQHVGTSWQQMHQYWPQQWLGRGHGHDKSGPSQYQGQPGGEES
ncbi:hypothetical protein CDD80_443 [Ophiocordyceps camponoti-rufipedis]|uniref:LsmAD domain-containing protein n=1 Tax=Ophiocordyceps camponoti-rufipedis TaxID=2004952 RepID=A0A2C5YGL1_9HYPO|nr:hypothetical protein CDD80_443 [Ophiocordyceps camponoti-rufipedis]